MILSYTFQCWMTSSHHQVLTAVKHSPSTLHPTPKLCNTCWWLLRINHNYTQQSCGHIHSTVIQRVCSIDTANYHVNYNKDLSQFQTYSYDWNMQVTMRCTFNNLVHANIARWVLNPLSLSCTHLFHKGCHNKLDIGKTKSYQMKQLLTNRKFELPIFKPNTSCIQIWCG